jgi:glutathione S-transferase
MILIGMLDSPFVRRVAISMKLLDLPFEHRSWSVGKDFDRIREYNPLGRVPALVLGDGEPGDDEVLIESSAILDYLDDRVGPARALLPGSGPARRQALKLMAIASGAAEKGVLQLYEKAFRPEDKRHEPWVARCRLQMVEALIELDRVCPEHDSSWLLGGQMSQADITAACVFTFCSEALALDRERYPRLSTLTARCEALPEFTATHLPFFIPSPTAS